MAKASVVRITWVVLAGMLIVGGCTRDVVKEVAGPGGTAMFVSPVFVVLESLGREEIVSVALRDEHNLPLAGLAVAVSLSDTQSGTIQFIDDSLQNVTDAYGSMAVRYVPTVELENELVFSVRGVSDTCWIRVNYFHDPDRFILHVVPDTLHISAGSWDSARVEVTLHNSLGVPLSGYRILLASDWGSSRGFLLTDSLGTTSTYWHTDAHYDSCHIFAFGDEMVESACITVLP